MPPSILSAPLAREAVDRLRRGGFLAYPTETVWGLGACADQPRAIERLMAWKGRAQQAPLAVLVSSADAARELGCEIAEPVRRLMAHFWPGPLMIVVPCRTSFAPGVTRADGALGLRCSPHPVAAALVHAAEEANLGPLTSTSLNRSGEPPARIAAEAERLVKVSEGPTPLDSPLLVSAADSDAGGAAPSTVVDCSGVEPVVLREGSIEQNAIERVWGES